jgi:hypothetical protein
VNTRDLELGSPPASDSCPAAIRVRVAQRAIDLFVWCVWALMLLVALAFVVAYGANIPFSDDWKSWLPPLAAGRPVTISWLWSPFGVSTHRCPVPRLILLGLYRITSSRSGWATWPCCTLRLGGFTPGANPS